MARTLLIMAAFVVVIAGMRASSTILVPFLLAAFISIVTTPVLFTMQRRGIRTGLALIVLIFVVGLLGFVSVSILGTSLTELTNKLPEYQTILRGELNKAIGWIEESGFDVSEDTVRNVLNPDAAVSWVGSLARALSGILSNGFLILLVVVFVLLEAAMLPQKIQTMPGYSSDTWRRVKQVVDDIRQYMLVKTVMSLFTGVLVTILLLAMDVDFALLLGVLAFVLNYVPNIGSFVAAIPGVFLALVLHGTGAGITTAVFYIIINVGVSNFIEPKFVGRELGVSPLVIILSMIFWGWVLGPVGMLLSVPLTMTAKIAMESDPETRWLAHLLGSSPVPQIAAEQAGGQRAAEPADAGSREG